jgi:hypothetical protein
MPEEALGLRLTVVRYRLGWRAARRSRLSERFVAQCGPLRACVKAALKEWPGLAAILITRRL